jgi:hypothetical protein
MYQETSTYIATEWQHLYSATLSESDHERRQRLIRQTEKAINDRYHSAGRALDEDELRKMAGAVWNLLQLRRKNNTVP